MNISDYIITVDNSVIEAMEVINKNARSVAYVCEDMKLCGVVTDGIIRRHIIAKGKLDDKVGAIMNSSPVYIMHSDSTDAYNLMEEKGITSIPVLNNDFEITTIKFLHASTIHATEKLNVPVVIMAGGKGKRLMPITQVVPKPLVTIDDRTIAEIIIEKFNEFGCSDFNLIVNYKKELIKSFFSESNSEYTISFTDEEEFLGTGGGLGFLKGKYNRSFFMSNCDILVEGDYGDIMRQHINDADIITIVCALKTFTVPYGTVEINESGNVAELLEKPSTTYMVNTGFYVINPRFLDYIPDNTFIHITDIIKKCIEHGENVGVYPIHENDWWDMGQPKELDKMRKAFNTN